MVSSGIWDKYQLMIFRDISKLPKYQISARDILVNFEISLAVFITNTARNHAISYTNFSNMTVRELFRYTNHGMINYFCISMRYFDINN